jgi:hypothetical protein
VLLGVVVVTVMMFLPSEWYEHYAAFDGPFVVLAVALPVGRLAAVTRPGSAEAFVVAAATTLVIAVMALASVSTSVMQGPVRSYASADSIIPPGACVVTDTASATIAINRFNATSSGCPQLVDSVGTLIATTDGQDLTGSRAVLTADTSVWQEVFSRAQYVWLIGRSGNTGARMAWTPALHAYFVRQFRLVGFASTFHGDGNVPRGGLYARRDLLPRNRFPGAANKPQQQHDAAWRLRNGEVAVRDQPIRIVCRPRHVPKRHAVVLGYPEQEARAARLVEPQRPTCPRMRDLNSHRLAGTDR